MVQPYCVELEIDALGGITIDGIVKEFFGEEDYIRDGNETCFKVKAKLKSGCWLLFFAVIVYTIISITIQQITKIALKARLPTEDEIEEYNRNHGNTNELEMKETKQEQAVVQNDNVVNVDNNNEQNIGGEDNGSETPEEGSANEEAN